MLALALLATGGVYFAARAYLHSEGFRVFLARKVNAAAGVEGSFEPFRWHGLAMNSGGFAATGASWMREVQAEGLHTEIDLGGLNRGVWLVENSEIQRLRLSIDATRPLEPKTDVPESLPPAKPGKKPAGWLPRDVEFGGLTVGDFAMDAVTTRGPFAIAGMTMEVRPDGAKDSYRLETLGGTLRLPFKRLREVRLNETKLRYHDGTVFLTKGTASAWSSARFAATGEWDLKTRRHILSGTLDGVKCGEALPPHWSRRVTGVLGTSFLVEGVPGAQMMSGKAELKNGTLTALPLLDSLAAYLDTSRFRTLVLTEARTDWRKQADAWIFENVVLASEGLLRIEGAFTLRGHQIDGRFNLGVSPAVLAKLPGAEQHVFLPGANGLSWTQVRVTGPADDLNEDLTERLLAAAGIRMIETLPETGEKVLKFSRSVLSEKHAGTVERVLDKGVDIIRENEDVIRETKGLLEGLLGE